MDRFVTKTVRNSCETGSPGKTKKVFVQSTIESLKGVVVVEEILRLKSKLLLPSTADQELAVTLHELGRKIPSKQVLLETKIGKVVNKLRNHKDENVSKNAETVYKKWRGHFEDFHSRPQIEVRSDLKTEKMRSSAKKFLASALQVELSHKLPDAVEREVFHQCKRLINVNYRRTMRSLVFTLQHQTDIRSRVLSGDLKLEKFVKEYKK